jgi:hypothetical protein
MIHAMIGAGVVACLLVSLCLAVAVQVRRARRDRTARARVVSLDWFLDELKTDAAYAAVCDYPYSGTDLLGMLGRHDLVTEDEISRLLRDATLRVPDHFDAEADDDKPHATNGSAGPSHNHPMDDEIPF